MSNLKEKFEQVINENVTPEDVYRKDYKVAASACVSVVIDMLEGEKEKLGIRNVSEIMFCNQLISQLKSLIQ